MRTNDTLPHTALDRALEIHVHGSPGDGAVIACRILARAFFRIGRDVSAFVAPRGGRGPADAVIVLDPGLLAGIERSSMRHDALIVVNAPGPPCSRLLPGFPLVAVDVSTIAARGPHPATLAAAMAGAFAAASGLVPLREMLFALEDEIPTDTGALCAACAEAWAETRALEPGRAPLQLAS
jgi:Pyruvate/2-oxoacid:ferredoxin oxidoreductase gamma subunit